MALVVLVCGGRDFNNYEIVRRSLAHLLNYDDVEIVEGGARGADRLARTFAEDHRIPFKTFSADWDQHGRSAGYIRNLAMLNYLLTCREEGAKVCVIAFPGGKGTANMTEIATKADIPVLRR